MSKIPASINGGCIHPNDQLPQIQDDQDGSVETPERQHWDICSSATPNKRNID